MPHTRAMGEGLFELRLKAKEGIARVFFCNRPGRRIVIDCGFTRYYTVFAARAAGATRLAQNVAAFLAGKDGPKKP